QRLAQNIGTSAESGLPQLMADHDHRRGDVVGLRRQEHASQNGTNAKDLGEVGRDSESRKLLDKSGFFPQRTLCSERPYSLEASCRFEDVADFPPRQPLLIR